MFIEPTSSWDPSVNKRQITLPLQHSPECSLLCSDNKAKEEKEKEDRKEKRSKLEYGKWYEKKKKR